MSPEPMEPEQVEEITEAARIFHEAMAEANLEATLKTKPSELQALARELDKVKRDQEDKAIAELAAKLNLRHSAVARVFRNYVPF